MCLLVSNGVTVVGGIRWTLVVFVSFLWRDLWWEQNSLICPKPAKCTSHPRLSNPAGCKAYSERVLTLCLVCGTLMTQRFPLTVFLCSTESLIECHLHRRGGGQRSGTARGQPPRSCDMFWILLKGTLACQTPIDTTVWTRLSDAFRFGKPLQLKMLRRSALAEVWLRFDWKQRVHHLFDTANSIKVQLFFILPSYFPLDSCPLPSIGSWNFTPFVDCK